MQLPSCLWPWLSRKNQRYSLFENLSLMTLEGECFPVLAGVCLISHGLKQSYWSSVALNVSVYFSRAPLAFCYHYNCPQTGRCLHKTILDTSESCVVPRMPVELGRNKNCSYYTKRIILLMNTCKMTWKNEFPGACGNVRMMIRIYK